MANNALIRLCALAPLRETSSGGVKQCWFTASKVSRKGAKAQSFRLPFCGCSVDDRGHRTSRTSAMT